MKPGLLNLEGVVEAVHRLVVGRGRLLRRLWFRTIAIIVSVLGRVWLEAVLVSRLWILVRRLRLLEGLVGIVVAGCLSAHGCVVCRDGESR
jgi:hypothetical protein